MAERGLLLVVSGPSGVGKTTIVHALRDRLGATLSVSMTTRDKTDADVEGVDYFFVDQARFKQAIDASELLEWAEVFGRERFYGTPRDPVEQMLVAGKTVILEIDVQGGLQVRQAMDEAMMIFIDPPNEQALLDRLRDRGREDETEIQRRFAEARSEIDKAHASDQYDHFVVNDQLESTIEAVVQIIVQHRAPEA
jgi:guanylate kinase